MMQITMVTLSTSRTRKTRTARAAAVSGRGMSRRYPLFSGETAAGGRRIVSQVAPPVRVRGNLRPEEEERTIVPRWILDRRLLDVGVDAAEHARELIVGQHRRLGGHRLAAVIEPVKADDRVGHGGEQVEEFRGPACGLLSCPPIECARRAEGQEPNDLRQASPGAHSVFARVDRR